MTFLDVVDRVSKPLRNRGRISYRALKLEFALSDDQLAGLKDELVGVQELAVDKDGKMLVWAGEQPVGSRQHSVVSREKEDRQRLQVTDPRPLIPSPQSAIHLPIWLTVSAQ
jgi:hypothetical protein